VTDPGALPDLAARRLGGMVLAANDEFFAAKENLLDPRPAVYDPERYTDRGKEMDGWETRRRREAGDDWCLVRLGVPGVVREVVVDTSFFRGNYPDACTIDACAVEGHPGAAQLLDDGTAWFPLLPRSPLQGDHQHVFDVDVAQRATHVRLWIHPDGGVARLRIRGEPLVDLRGIAGADHRLDLAAFTSGGRALAASDLFFSSPNNLLMVGDARDMADGWETRRRRGAGHDWVVVRLATQGVVERVEVDTTNFKGNHPDSCRVETADVPAGAVPADGDWTEVVPSAQLAPHARHVFRTGRALPATHLRLSIHPDGGVARLRAYGRITDDGWRHAGVRWLDAQTTEAAVADLLACCGSSAWATGVAARRPFATFAALTEAADAVWRGLGPDDWRQAFSAHPRIGERTGSPWSQREQAGTAAADPGILEALAEGNRAYEDRFGHVFLICATGKTAEQMLSALHERLGNDPDTELRVAAEEQHRITRLRLDALVRPPTDPPAGPAS
jgi:allantoicase